MLINKVKASKMLSCSIPTLNRYLGDGKIQFFKRGTSRTSGVLINTKEIYKFLKNNKKSV